MNASETVKIFSLKNVLRKASENKIEWILSFTILTIISAQFAVPVKPVPFTLQTVAVLLSGAFLGSKKGAISQFIYLFLGIIGLPVFAQTPEGAIGFARDVPPAPCAVSSR
ncbi:MAG TPA: biotin transporter BioY [Ignavibacteriaceae bacterium]|nr:biotin transporter BioY [Ignavibacteriaceae bacterium]